MTNRTTRIIEYIVAGVMAIAMGAAFIADRIEKKVKVRKDKVAIAPRDTMMNVDALDSAINDVNRTLLYKSTNISLLSKELQKRDAEIDQMRVSKRIFVDSTDRRHGLRVAYLSAKIEKLSKDIEELKMEKDDLKAKIKSLSSENRRLRNSLDSALSIKPRVIIVHDTAIVVRPVKGKK